MGLFAGAARLFSPRRSVPPGQPQAERRIDQEMLSAEALDEVPLTFSAEPATTPPGEPGVHVVLNLDVAHLQLVNRSGMRTEQLTVIAALFDADGNFVTGKGCEIDFKMKDAIFNKLSSGTTAGLTLHAPPGKYRLCGVVRGTNRQVHRIVAAGRGEVTP